MDTDRTARIAAVRLPAWAKGLSVPERHQLRIALDTVENPSKALLGGPSVEEAKEIVEMLRSRSRTAANARRVAGRIVAGAMKRFVEDVSAEMGLGGEINDEVLAEAQRRLDQPPEKRVAAAAKEMAAGLREAAGRLDRLGSRAEGVAPVPLPELVDVFLDALSGVESRVFYKRQLLDSIRHPRP